MSERSFRPSRRSMLQSAALAGGAWVVPHWFTNRAAAQESTAPRPAIADGATVLLQGDSITDAGRGRDATGPNDATGFGRGYAFMIGSYLLAAHPYAGLKVYNRGISGNKVPDLDARWDQDCLELQPDIVSILIGVNDIWHKLNGRYDGSVASYEEGYAALLARTKAALPAARIVVCEPFVLSVGAVDASWFPEFDERRAAARRVAEGAGAVWVPFHGVFEEAAKHEPPGYWAGDGVHPTMAGHALMAATWIQRVLG